MAKFSPSQPPALSASVDYKAYRPWLLFDYYKNLCSYCLLHHEELHEEHYEPKHYAPTRVNDPTNLLLACARCNGGGGKGDYHPNHLHRHRGNKTTHGFHIIDVREDDFGQLMTLDSSGRLQARPGDSRDRVEWNIVFLKLNLAGVPERRRTLLRMRDAGEGLVLKSRNGDEHRAFEVMADNAADHLLFFEVLNLPLSEALRAELVARKDAGRASHHSDR